MSTESLHHSKFGRDVKPEPHHKPSFVNTVSKLIHRAVPQPGEVSVKEVERIIWVAFEKWDLNDPMYKRFLSHICGSEMPLIIVLGLCNGFQIWGCMFNGDCVELLSVRDQPVSIVKFLPSYGPPGDDAVVDEYADSRPLLAVVAHSRSEAQTGDLILLSLRTGSTVHTVKCTEQVGAVLANSLFVITTTSESIRILHAGTFKELITVTEHCLPNPHGKSSIALGSRWLAYPDYGISRSHQSFGGVCLDEPLHCSRFASVAKTVTKTVSELSKSMSGSAAITKCNSPRSWAVVEKLVTEVGVVTVLDLAAFPQTAKGIRDVSPVCQGVVAHFAAHLDEKVACMAFSPNGSLLLTGGESGREFHLFNVLPNPYDSCLTAIHHLYTLSRGSTNAAVQDIAFSEDCRWLAVTTVNGTSHVFPITPYGGPTSVRTHGGSKVVNRESRFERSSGVAVLPCRAPATGRRSADIPCTKTGSPVVKKFHPGMEGRSPYLSRIVKNPRLPPYPLPVGQVAVAKVKPSESKADMPSTDICLWRQATSVQGTRLASQSRAGFFAPIRGLRALSDTQLHESHSVGFYAIGIDGKLCEFTINTKGSSSNGSKSASDTCCLEASLLPAAEWFLCRTKFNPCVQPPLDAGHLFLLVNDTVKAQRSKIMTRKVPTSNEVETWTSEIEIVTYAGPHRRLWMGPQFTFKKYFGRAHSTSSVSVRRSTGKSEPVAVACRLTYNVLPVVLQKKSGGSSYETPSEMTIEVYGSWSDNDYRMQSENEEALRRHITQAMQEEEESILCTVTLSDGEMPASLQSDEESTDSSTSCQDKEFPLSFSSLLDV